MLTPKKGYFGSYGGTYVPETIMPALEELEKAFYKYKQNKEFNKKLTLLLTTYAGRPTPLYFAKRLTKHYKQGKIFLKREDLCHTGAHKINNCIGQALLAKAMGKNRVIAETGAGQHGLATATVCALLNLQCVIYMGKKDIKRQEVNVLKMKLLGANVIPVESGSRTLKDAINESLRDWTANVQDTHYLLGSVLGPHPFPTLIKHFQSVIRIEAKEQIMEIEGRLPSMIIACVGGGSNAIGIFNEFINDKNVKLIGVEAGGEGISTGNHAARFADSKIGRVGVLHGTKTYVLQDMYGQIRNTSAIAAGLDYCAVGPEHSLLHESKRVEYTYATDSEAFSAFKILSKEEGIIPALESAHAVAHALKIGPTLKKDNVLIINLSGRGDKDLDQVKDLI